jgi:ankyrin repeat protein
MLGFRKFTARRIRLMSAFKTIRDKFNKVFVSPFQKKKDRELFAAALGGGSLQFMRELLGKHDDAFTWRDKGGSAMLHHAAVFGDIALCELLLKRGADISARDNQGYTPLHHAAQIAPHAQGDDPTATLKFLLSRGAYIEARNNLGETPLMHAVNRNKPWNVRALILAGANPNAAATADNPAMGGRRGDTPLTQAARYPGGIFLELQSAMDERQRLLREAAAQAAEAERQAKINAAVADLSNGLAGTVAVKGPLRLRKDGAARR